MMLEFGIQERGEEGVIWPTIPEKKKLATRGPQKGEH